jgi:hypothetical protein
MPRRRSGHTTAVTIGTERFYLTANQRDDGSLGEVFIHWGKHGTSSAGLVSTYAIALSVGLQHRVPLGELIRPGLGQHFTPNGRTDDPEIPRVCSAVDYIARRLAIDWLPYSDRAPLGIYTLTERVRCSELTAGLGAGVTWSYGLRRRRKLRAAFTASLPTSRATTPATLSGVTPRPASAPGTVGRARAARVIRR